MSQKV